MMNNQDPLAGDAKKNFILDFSRKNTMNRYRLRHKTTGEVVELSSHSEMGACHAVHWKKENTWIILLGKKSILNRPRFYVRPETKSKKEG